MARSSCPLHAVTQRVYFLPIASAAKCDDGVGLKLSVGIASRMTRCSQGYYWVFWKLTYQGVGIVIACWALHGGWSVGAQQMQVSSGACLRPLMSGMQNWWNSRRSLAIVMYRERNLANTMLVSKLHRSQFVCVVVCSCPTSLLTKSITPHRWPWSLKPLEAAKAAVNVWNFLMLICQSTQGSLAIINWDERKDPHNHENWWRWRLACFQTAGSHVNRGHY